MNNLYNKIYEAVNTGISKALIITDDQSEDISVNFHYKEISNEFIPYDCRTVNLGLPSGLLWCEYNLGAEPGDNPEDWYGNYYACGETKPKIDFTQDTYKYGYEDNLIKYNKNDNLTRLAPEDDAVCKITKNQYRMPTKEDYKELIENTKIKYVQDYKGIKGLNGKLCISKINSNTLFFPSSGIYQNTECCYLDDGFIWTSSLNQSNINQAYALYSYIYASGFYINSFNRFFGLPIRGVKESKQKI